MSGWSRAELVEKARAPQHPDACFALVGVAARPSRHALHDAALADDVELRHGPVGKHWPSFAVVDHQRRRLREPAVPVADRIDVLHARGQHQPRGVFRERGPEYGIGGDVPGGIEREMAARGSWSPRDAISRLMSPAASSEKWHPAVTRIRVPERSIDSRLRRLPSVDMRQMPCGGRSRMSGGSTNSGSGGNAGEEYRSEKRRASSKRR